MNHHDVWRGSHKDIDIEIVHWGVGCVNDGAGIWNYYLHISEAQLSPEDFDKIWLEPHEENPLMAGWGFHGGITFYEKRVNPDTKGRSIQVGCDFAHYWDKGQMYDLNDVLSKAIATVEAALASLRFKRRCPFNGSYCYPEDMVEHEGILYSRAAAKTRLGG